MSVPVSEHEAQAEQDRQCRHSGRSELNTDYRHWQPLHARMAKAYGQKAVRVFNGSARSKYMRSFTLLKSPVTENETQTSVFHVLEWYRAMGVEAVVEETSIDWRGRAGPASGFNAPPRSDHSAQASFQSATPRRDALRTPSRDNAAMSAIGRDSAPAVSRTAGSGPTTPSSPDAAAAKALALAREAASLEALGKAIESFDGCNLKRTASRMCFYRGAHTARLMIVGEAPGREEDLSGLPFVGAAGQLLDRILTAAGIEPAAQHITNVVYWRPPGNRTPTPEEVEICLPFLLRQISLVKPEILLILGAAAARALLRTQEGITRVRGQWQKLAADGLAAEDDPRARVRAIATLHPAFLLRTPAAKKQVWRDILTVKAALDRGAH